LPQGAARQRELLEHLAQVVEIKLGGQVQHRLLRRHRAAHAQHRFPIARRVEQAGRQRRHAPPVFHAGRSDQLHRAAIDAPSGARRGRSDGADQLLFEPGQRRTGGITVDRTRGYGGVYRPSHHGQAQRQRRMTVLGQQRHRGQGRHAGLANRQQVRAGSDFGDEAQQIVDIVVQPEAALGQRHIAGVLPVGDVDIERRQQTCDRLAQLR
jgi:hypothetical protein